MALKQKFFSGPTLTQALLAAARHHQVNPDDVAYREMDRKQGLRASRAIVIEVDPDNPTVKVADDEPTVAAVETTHEEPAAETPSAPAVEEAPEVVASEEPEPEAEPEPAVEEASAPVLEAVVEEVPAPEAPEAEADAPSWLPPAPVDEGEEEPPSWVAQPPSTDEDETLVAQDSPLLEDAVAPAPAAVEEEAAGPVTTTGDSAPPRREPVVIDDALRQAVSEAVDELAHIASLRVQVTTVESFEDGVNVEIEGPDSERMTARGGRALLAIQHLLPRLLFATLGRAIHCRVDSDGFHESRVERLQQLALKAADRVRTGGRSWLLDPMPPDERRLVHMALADESDVETESVGRGFLKRVRVAQA